MGKQATGMASKVIATGKNTPQLMGEALQCQQGGRLYEE
jgi:hypothetical protein